MRAINVEVSEVLKKLDFRPRSTCCSFLVKYVAKKAQCKFTCSLTLDLHLHFIYMFILHLHYIYIYIIIFMYFLQNVIWLNTRTGLRYKRHILHAPKYDE